MTAGNRIVRDAVALSRRPYCAGRTAIFLYPSPRPYLARKGYADHSASSQKGVRQLLWINHAAAREKGTMLYRHVYFVT